LRPGLHPGPRWGSLQRSPDPLAALREERRGRMGRNGRTGKGRRGAEKRKGRECRKR